MDEAGSSSFEPIDPLMRTFKEDLDISLEATKEILWEQHYGAFGRGVSMFMTDAAMNLVWKGIPDMWVYMSIRMSCKS